MHNEEIFLLCVQQECPLKRFKYRICLILSRYDVMQHIYICKYFCCRYETRLNVWHVRVFLKIPNHHTSVKWIKSVRVIWNSLNSNRLHITCVSSGLSAVIQTHSGIKCCCPAGVPVCHTGWPSRGNAALAHYTLTKQHDNRTNHSPVAAVCMMFPL